MDKSKWKQVPEEECKKEWLDGVCEHIMLEEAEPAEGLQRDGDKFYRVCVNCAGKHEADC